MTTVSAIGGRVAAGGSGKAKLAEAARAFEAVFIRQLMSSMRAASLGDDIFGSSAGEQFRDLADARTADDMAARGTFGIAELLLAQLGQAPAAAAAERSK